MTRDFNSTDLDVEAPLWLTVATAELGWSEAVVDDNVGAFGLEAWFEPGWSDAVVDDDGGAF